MRCFKIPLCRIFTEKSETIQEQTVYESKTLGQKLGYDTYQIYVLNHAQIIIISYVVASDKL